MMAKAAAAVMLELMAREWKHITQASYQFLGLHVKTARYRDDGNS